MQFKNEKFSLETCTNCNAVTLPPRPDMLANGFFQPDHNVRMTTRAQTQKNITVYQLHNVKNMFPPSNLGGLRTLNVAKKDAPGSNSCCVVREKDVLRDETQSQSHLKPTSVERDITTVVVFHHRFLAALRGIMRQTINMVALENQL